VDDDETGRKRMEEVPGSEFEIDADLVLLALGFVHPEHDVPGQLGLELNERGNIQAAYEGPDAYKTSHPKVFAAGDARYGQSLVVRAIHEGREAARAVDVALMGRSDLPSINAYGYDPAAPG
jgi:glutamate synthase (NADPH/NADH) small chain